MQEWLLGLLLGGFLGIFDGPTAPLSVHETAPELPQIDLDSVIKGFIAGVLCGGDHAGLPVLTYGRDGGNAPA
jgi:hypothetical protein